MTEDVIKIYDTFNAKRCTDDLTCGDFNCQPILSNYYKFLNDDDGDGNNIPGTPVDNSLLYN